MAALPELELTTEIVAQQGAVAADSALAAATGPAPGALLLVGLLVALAAAGTWALGVLMARQEEPALRLATSLGSAAMLSSACVLMGLPIAVGLICALAALGIAAVLDAPSANAGAVAREAGSGRLPPALDSASLPALLVDRAGRVTAANDAAATLLGRKPLGVPLTAIMPSLPPARLLPGGAAGPADGPLATTALDETGQLLPVELSLSWSRGDGGISGLALLRDERARHAELAELEQRALHDPLTGLPNRALFYDRLDQALAGAARDGLPVGLLLLDLDRFKLINDALGHPIGDLVLQAVGPRLAGPLRRADTLARLGGDEFAVVLPPPVAAQDARRVGERLIESLREPFRIEGLSLDLGVSIGLAMAPEHGQDRDALIRSADAALYAAKAAGGGVVAFEPGEPTEAMRRLGLRDELREAIAAGALTLHYQPIVEPRTGAVVAIEALVRWQHPRHGLLMPAEFLPVAERGGLLPALTGWVLGEALAEQARWRAAGHALRLSVNLAPRWLEDDKLPGLIRGILREHRVPAGMLTLEVGEDHVMGDPARSLPVLRALAQMGCEIALDDVGLGRSCLSILRELPVVELKLAPAIVAQSHPAIVESWLRIARSLGLRTVAEGVERAETLEAVTGGGADLAQGFVIAAPLDADGLASWLGRHAVALSTGQPVDALRTAPEDPLYGREAATAVSPDAPASA